MWLVSDSFFVVFWCVLVFLWRRGSFVCVSDYCLVVYVLCFCDFACVFCVRFVLLFWSVLFNCVFYCVRIWIFDIWLVVYMCFWMPLICFGCFWTFLIFFQFFFFLFFASLRAFSLIDCLWMCCVFCFWGGVFFVYAFCVFWFQLFWFCSFCLFCFFGIHARAPIPLPWPHSLPSTASARQGVGSRIASRTKATANDAAKNDKISSKTNMSSLNITKMIPKLNNTKKTHIKKQTQKTLKKTDKTIQKHTNNYEKKHKHTKTVKTEIWKKQQLKKKHKTQKKHYKQQTHKKKIKKHTKHEQTQQKLKNSKHSNVTF